jgi:UPF0176 protein
MNNIRIIAFYKFARLPHYGDLRKPLLQFCRENGIHGTILLAPEGINATVAGTPDSMKQLIEKLLSHDEFKGLEWKESFFADMPFKRMKVRLKKEIVGLGIKHIDPTRKVGEYVSPKEWNKLIEDPEVIVIDTRNHFEYEFGTFSRAIDPRTKSFRQFPKFVRESLADAKEKKIAMFCTGGIRCEKATAYLLEEGFANVYHLHGGILKYFEEIPKEESLFNGECFVFDERITVDHSMQKGSYDSIPTF